MSFTIQFADQGLGLILKRTAGSAPSKALADTFAVFWNNNRPALSTIRYLYSDYTEAGKFEVTTGDILRLAEIAKTIALDNKALIVAICAPQPEHFGLARMWQSHLLQETGWITRVFREQDEAKAWLQQTMQEMLTFL